ncbi:NHLP leader peptide family RiPP precursor [Nitrospirillum sp. BR 11163]|uniref:NHLP leader peptide family RiPP precursor n=1 Tax=Nitrospirillum sp. BR 11163 TaxID=3104323 RepID=UPI002AFFE7C5|nr:NHLP leader peptide family RiPP precursor [Nitrospirillum sp. BR 11163]MEA1671869.1 NHLP leader peptide family RiPP precursor [Nitrospirillum sp. BR 11163]
MNQGNAAVTGRIVARAWADDAFKARLLADPEAVLRDEGVDLPASVTVRVAVDTDAVRTLVLPAKPVDLTEEELGRVVGGGDPSYCANWCLCCANCAI